MKFALFNLGFRPFFLFGSLYALVSVAVWVLIYSSQLEMQTADSSPMIWHGHEMIFGYAAAVITGFLLTAARNWTGIQTLHGWPLFLLLLCWLIARILGFTDRLLLQAVFDNLFLLFFAVALTRPIVRAKHWKSLGIVSKIVLLMASNIVFYLGGAHVLENGERIGLFSGLYLVIALILVLSRRVLPFFTERGVGYPVELTNRLWLDRISLLLFLFFWIADIIDYGGILATLLAAILFVLHVIRIHGWYTPGIWRQPLLWCLFSAYVFIILGFLLKTLAGITTLSPNLAIHAFTYGGIGMMTLGMMSRVALGHTGRNVYAPSSALFWMFVVFLSGAVIRVIFPVFAPGHYLLWIQWSHIHWLIAFSLFVFLYASKLILPRVDGKPG